MNLSRRKFASLLGLSPLAAKAAADAEIAKLVGSAREISPPVLFGANSHGPPIMGGDDYMKVQLAAADYSKLVGIPDFVKENIRRNCGYVSSLDPDLAAKRSWSMSVKIATQRQRNYDRYIEQMEHNAWHAKARSGFKVLTGWDWPW